LEYRERKIIRALLVLIFYVLAVLGLSAQDIIYSEEFAKLKPGEVRSDLGDDITAPALTTVVLDASRSRPQNGSLTYKWLFPPNMILVDDYNFSDSDTHVLYPENSDGIQSLNTLTTREKYIEFELPNLPGQAYEVLLYVKNHIGTEDYDTLIVTVEEPILLETNEKFSVIDSEIVDEKKISLIDESTALREPLTETAIYDDLLTIQAINKSKLNPMAVSIVNDYIFNFLQHRGLQSVLDPNRNIPEKISINKMYNFSRIEHDTITTVYLDTISSGEDLSNFSEDPIDTVFKAFMVDDSTTRKKTYYVYRQYKSEAYVDTLTYTEIVDTTLNYNFDCIDYDCAAENAYLEQAGSVLSWGINQYAQLEFHYFTLNDIYESELLTEWLAEPIIMNPPADSILRYPESIAFDPSGSTFLVSGNRQNIYFSENNLEPMNIMGNMPDGSGIEYPSGICVGPSGELYVVDKSKHSIFRIYKGIVKTIYSTPRSKDGSLIAGEPTAPTVIRLNSLGEIVVLFEGDGSIRKFNEIGNETLLLQPGKIEQPTDIALNSDDTLFVLSTQKQQVYKVKNDDEFVAYAGTQGTSTTAMDGVLATESFLGEPVSIDFDSSNRLYIADNVFGSIRVVNPDGMITTLTGKIEDRVYDITQLRVNNYNLTTLYATHTLQHKITRFRFHSYAPSSRFGYIHYPYYVINQEGIYGLERSVKEVIEAVLVGTVPKEKRSIFKRFSDATEDLSGYLKSHPIIFGLLFILINQGISEVLSGGGPVDSPPDFPPL